jgi:hypothetical protein
MWQADVKGEDVDLVLQMLKKVLGAKNNHKFAEESVTGTAIFTLVMLKRALQGAFGDTILGPDLPSLLDDSLRAVWTDEAGWNVSSKVVPIGIMPRGAPGTGKSGIVRLISESTGIPVCTLDVTRLNAMYVKPDDVNPRGKLRHGSDTYVRALAACVRTHALWARCFCWRRCSLPAH